jgi:tetratricopeptide (TPR) repeat protein
MDRISWRTVAWLHCLLLALPLVALGAGGPATDLAGRCEQAMQDGAYAKAAEVGEQFLKDYPTGGDLGPDGVFKIRYNLAWCYYLIEDYPKAIQRFKELDTDKVPSAELREQARQLVGDSYSRYAGALKEPKEKKDNYTKAIETYTSFIKDFSKSQSMPDVLYGRGLAYFRIEKYDDSARDLRQQLRDFATSDLRLDTEYLLATVLGTHGSALRREGKADDAKKYLEEARDLFKKIIASTDIALANDAAYAAGEIFIQLKEYETAISYYRSVRTREEVLASQNTKLEMITKLFGQASAAGEKRRAEALRNLRMKESSKLREIKASPDLLLASYMRIGDCFFQQKKYDEARVMYNFLLPHAKQGDPEVAKAAAAQIVACYVGAFKPDMAKAAFDEFQKDYGADKLGEPFGLAIGDLYMRKSKFEEAKAVLEKALEDYPESTLKPSTQMRLAQALDALGKPDEAKKLIDEALKSKDLREQAGDEVNYALGRILKGTQQFDEAIKTFGKISSSFELIDDVKLQIALCHRGKGKTEPKEMDKAIGLLEDFVKDFQGKSDRIPYALFQIGQCYEEKDDIDKAVKAYGELVNKHSGDKFGPLAQYQIAIVWYNKQNWTNMVTEFERLIQKFPKDPLVCDAHFWIGYKFQNEKNWPKAVEQFDIVVKDCHDNPIAPDALYRIGNSWQTAALSTGNYKAQDEKGKAAWRENAAKSIAAFEKLLTEYPNATQVDTALEGLTQLELSKVVSEIEKPSDVDAYFNRLSSQFASDQVLAAKVLFCLASVYYKINKPEEAIATFRKAFEGAGDIRLAADYYDQYGELLVATKKFDEGIDVYLKMEAQYKDDQQNLAHAVWGLGNAYLQAGLYEKAIVEFDRLIKDFPWHKHAADAQFGKGLVLESQGKCDEAIKIYEDVTVKLKGEARIRALLGLGRCLMKKGDYKAALDNFQKVSLFYEKYAEFASEALWLGGQCAEKLPGATPQETEKNKQSAIQQYRDLMLKYSTTKYVEDAKKRLAELAPSK